MADFVTGGAVVVDLPVARFPSRLIALAIDVAVQLVLLGAGVGVVASLRAAHRLDDASAAAFGLGWVVLVLVGYPVIFETTTRGRSLGKLALGLRVVGENCSPERFRQALLRALTAVVEIWILEGVPALLCSLVSEKGKRLGDVFAGTFVIQQRVPARAATAVMPPVLAGWAARLELSSLPEQTAAMARQYLARYFELSPAARDETGRRIAVAVAARVSPPPPPGTFPADYLSAVLAERRAREQARLAARRPWDQAAPGQPPVPQPWTGAASGQPPVPQPWTGAAPGQPPAH